MYKQPLENSTKDTIAAISTPHGLGGIGIIRISGSRAISIVNQISNTSFNLLSLTSIKTRKLIYAIIVDRNQEKIDEVLLALMPPEKSYTGEETIEIQCHGGQSILSLILECVLELGARMAKPGEFTQRAFQNGRISLIQAEAINEVIRARTGNAVKAAWRKFDSGLNTYCDELKRSLENICVQVHSEIDFEFEDKVDIFPSLANIKKIIDNLLMQNSIKTNNDGIVWVTLIGPTNSGKSSLFNRILRTNRALVSDYPGTTTDFISETIEINGKEIKVTDTAGYKNPNSDIQSISIENTIKQKKAADILLFIVDQSMDITKFIQEMKEVLDLGGIIVFNKCDLKRHITIENFNKQYNNCCFYTSVLYEQGIEELMDELEKKIDEKFNDYEVIMNIRHRGLLLEAKEEIEFVIKNKYFIKTDIMFFHIREAIKNIKELIGDIKSEDTLNNIFSKFCIGK